MLVVLSLGTAFSDSQRGAGDATTQWIAVAVYAGFIAWGWFTAIAVIANRLLPNVARTRGVVAALLYVTTEAIRAVAVGIFAVEVGLAVEVDWAFRIVAGGLTGLIVFGLPSIVLNDAWAFRRQRIELGEIQSSLRQAVEMRRSDLEARFAELAESVREAVHVALRAIGQEHPDGPESARLAASELTRISDEVVRPLSHDLYRDISFAHDATDIEAARVTFASVADRASTVQPFRPAATVVVAALLLAGQVLFGGVGAQAIGALVGGLALVAALLWLAQRWVAPQLSTLPTLTRWVIIWLIFAGLSVAGGWVLVPTLIAPPADDYPAVVAYSALIGMLMLTAIAAGPGLRAARNEAIEEITRSNRNLQWQIARLNAQLLTEQKAVARALHRDVQGVLVAASLRLEEAVRRGESIEDAGREVRELIELATNFAIARQPLPLTAVLIENLQDLWLSVLDIDVTLPDTVVRALDTDTIARRGFADVAGEFCVDSVKHGHAHTVRISAAGLSSDALTLTMENDGLPLTPDAPSGLGDEVFASSLLSFRRENIDGGIRATAELPLEHPAATQ